MVKYVKYMIFSSIVLTTILGSASFVYESAVINETRDFDAVNFRMVDFSDEDLSLFCDIAFTDDEVRIRKWRKDIKVEIKNIEELDSRSVEEVDSVIAILAPLIAPLKIERVRRDGNLHVYRRVEKVNPSKPEPFCLNGLARINKVKPYSWDITYASIYDGCEASSQTLMHEFEHALGLNHPIKLYSYYVTIGRSVIPQYLRSQKEIIAFRSQPFYLSDQEKSVIKMLYSDEIKSGMHIETFARKMGFTDEDRKRMIPDINKKPRIIVYPSPDDY